MIDLHSHILSNVDDGSSSALETFMMLKEAEKAGFTDIFATPHFILNSLEQNKNEILEQIKEINEAAKNEGIHIKVHSGEEIYLMPDLKRLIDENKLITLNLSKYILIEFPMHEMPLYIDDVIFEICNLGYVPIIAHPERYDYVKKNVDMVAKWQNSGAFIQCNYGSLIGKYGHDAKKILIKLLKSKNVDFMATDCHRAGSIYDNMEDSLRKLKKLIDKEYCEQITTLNAKRIL